MKKYWSLILVVIAIVSLVVAAVYLSKSAGSLPHFFPGYTKGSLHKHTKHAIAFIGLAVVLFLGAWMVSGSGNGHSNHPTTPAS